MTHITNSLYMKSNLYTRLLGAVVVAALIAGCSAASKEDDKKARLEKLKTEQADLSKEIAKLEEEIAKENPDSVSVRAKDVSVIELAPRFEASIILVADLYLGSINHTLLTCRELESRKLNVKGIIFNGPPNAESERIILHHTGLSCLLKIGREGKIDKATVTKYAGLIKQTWA